MGQRKKKKYFNKTALYLVLITIRLELIEEVIEIGDTLLKSLALTDASDDGSALAASLEWITRNCLPVVEHTLREGLTLSLSTKIIIETE